MRRVVLALLRVLPNRLAVPVHLFEALETAGVVLRRVQDVAVVQQVGIRADRPRVDDAAFHVQQVRPAADAEQGVAVEGFLLVVEQQFGRALQAFVGEGRTGEYRPEDQCAFHRGFLILTWSSRADGSRV